MSLLVVCGGYINPSKVAEDFEGEGVSKRISLQMMSRSSLGRANSMQLSFELASFELASFELTSFVFAMAEGEGCDMVTVNELV